MSHFRREDGLILAQVHHRDHTRGMSIHPSDTYDHLVRALRAKFPTLGSRVGVRFRDEDGEMLSMQDDGDFEAAVDVARSVPHRTGAPDLIDASTGY